jgi:V/A-type H+-transporting ATPase subunit E
MAEELQGLLDRIHQEGIKKADDEKNIILQAAKKQAGEIISDAKKEADLIRKKAEADAVNNEARGKAAVAQAARDIILKLRQEFQSRLEAVIKDSVGTAMTPEFMTSVLRQMVEGFKNLNADTEPKLELLVAAKDLAEMERLLRGGLAENFKQAPHILAGPDIGAGLKFSFSGNNFYFDFSDDAIADIICAYAGPRLAEMIKA